MVRPPKVIGHRGAAGSAPENTLAGFRRAAALGAPWVEFDARLTADGQAVVFHDDRLERTTNGRGRLATTPVAELRRLDAGAWFGAAFAGERVPTVGEALALIAALGMGANMEIKPDPGRDGKVARAAMEAALAAWPEGREPPLVSSFSSAALVVAREVAPDWPRGLLVDRLPSDWRDITVRLDCATLHCGHRGLDARGVAAVRDAGLEVLAFTVNEPDRARRLWDWGVAGVFTDFPERLLAAL
ncbi:MAG: glycerophosphodiester phosphodiesterase [Rhodospirillales bacterium]|nr:glycerophosphodiester phosphodiesterase [Rhodospirillales bacterium]